MSNWNDLPPNLREAISGQADKETWPMLSKERQQELIDQAKASRPRQKQSGQLETVTETRSKRTERKARERQERAAQREKERAARAREREEMRRGIIKASGGSVKKNYAYGGRVAKYKE